MTAATSVQSVIVTLADGRRGVFTGPALVTGADWAQASIVSVAFTSARPLPAGTTICTLADLEPARPPRPGVAKGRGKGKAK